MSAIFGIPTAALVAGAWLGITVGYHRLFTHRSFSG
jgi:fatty-acid desaturase